MERQVADGGELVSSRLLHLEARRIYVREHLLGARHASAIVDLAAEIRGLPVTDEVWEGAAAIDRHVRTLDSIHLATCHLIGADLLSSDASMVEAARHLGITVRDAD